MEETRVEVYQKTGEGYREVNFAGEAVPDNAGAHNARFRGKDLTGSFHSGQMSEAIASGTFADLYPGDYLIKSVTVNGVTYENVKWIVGDLDYHLHRGDLETTAHHVLVFPEDNLGNARMNASDTTEGGYTGSEMWTATIPKYAEGIVDAFGEEHVLKHRELLTNAVNAAAASGAGAGLSGCATNWKWTEVTANLFNEPMLYGTKVLSSSFYDIGDCDMQVAAIRHQKSLSLTRKAWCWLRAISSSSGFCPAGDLGNPRHTGASDASGGVRPYFLLY